MRLVEQPVLITAFTLALTKPTTAPVVEFFLTNMSQRLAQAVREEMEGRGKVKEKDGEDAMTAIVTTIRQLEGAGELVLIREEE